MDILKQVVIAYKGEHIPLDLYKHMIVLNTTGGSSYNRTCCFTVFLRNKEKIANVLDLIELLDGKKCQVSGQVAYISNGSPVVLNAIYVEFERVELENQYIIRFCDDRQTGHEIPLANIGQLSDLVEEV